MKKLLFALLAFVPLSAQAQNAIIQEGTVLRNSPTMFTGDRKIRQGAPAAGAATGRIVTTGMGIVGGVCDFSGPTDIADGYNRLCVDATNGRVLFESTKAVPPGLAFNVLGVDYPFFGPGNGNVQGPTPTVVNELASWNSTIGGALRQGAARITDDKTAAFPYVDAAGLEVKSQSAASAQFIFSCILNPVGCATDPSNYDAVRGVVINPTGSVNLLSNGVASYIMNSAARSIPVVASFPVTVNFFGASVCDADGCGVWGLNTVLADNRGQFLSVHGPRYLFNELDFNVTSAQTQVSGLNFTGAAIRQPAYAVATGCLALDGVNNGTIAKWTSCHISTDGATTTFASIGAQQNTGTNINSQNFSFGYFDGAGVAGATTLAATSTGMLVASSAAVSNNWVLGSGGSFQTTVDNTGVLLNNRFIALAQAGVASIASDVNWTTVNLGSTAGTVTLHGTLVNVAGAADLRLAGGGALWVEPRVAPASPTGGWYLYVDSGDANKLKAKASNGTVITLATP